MNSVMEEWGLIEEEFVCDLDGFVVTEEDEMLIASHIEDRWNDGESVLRLI